MHLLRDAPFRFTEAAMPRTSLVKEAESLLAELDRAATSRAAVDERRDRRTPFRRSRTSTRWRASGARRLKPDAIVFWQ